jgi:hypothetical protein
MTEIPPGKGRIILHTNEATCFVEISLSILVFQRYALIKGAKK